MKITLEINDNTKINFLFELLRKLEFVKITNTISEEDDFDADDFLANINKERQESAKDFSTKIETLFENI
jgi:hypothetical protein